MFRVPPESHPIILPTTSAFPYHYNHATLSDVATPQSTSFISNNSSFHMKHPGVPDGSDSSGRTSYPLLKNQMRPVAQGTGHVACLPCGGYYTMRLISATRNIGYAARRGGVRLPLLSLWNVVTCSHHLNDTYVTLFAGVADVQ